MPKTLTQLTIFASGTSETESERAALKRVAEELNKKLEKTHAITIRVRAWPDDVRPGVSAYPQAELNRQLGTDYDIYLGVLGARFGTATRQAGSGTAEEFNLALEKLQENSQSIRLLFYFKNSIEDPFSLDLKQLQSVKDFRAALPDKGVVFRDFKDTSDFVQQTSDHLYHLIVDEWEVDHWRRITGIGRPPAQGQPGPTGAGSTEAAGSGEDATERSEKEPMPRAEAADEEELGYLEYVEKFHAGVPALIETFEQMTAHTETVGQRIRERTAQSDAILQEQNRTKGVGGSRDQQQQLALAKEVVNAAADDIATYGDAMAAALGQYRTTNRVVFENFRFALESGAGLWSKETREENRTAVLNMIEAMETTLRQMSDFQGVIKRLPALTGRFKKARNHAASVIGELIAEITFSIGEARQLINLLANSGTEAFA